MRTLLVAILIAMSGLAQEYNGYIVDEKCAANPGMRGNKECASGCTKMGYPAVFVNAEGTIYKTSEQNKVKDFAGRKVIVNGSIAGDTIKVENIKAAEIAP